jgi:dTDP-4-dehydrorhamnose 3,5-epimerase
MTVEFRELALEGVFEVCPRKFSDARGFFSETWNAQAFRESALPFCFVQDNHSFSRERGILRGLHYQSKPHAQDKLVRVVRGAIFDVVVDIRPESPTFARWVALEISAASWNQIFVPADFAHGFVTLEPNTEVIYKVTSHYSAEHDRSIRFDDPDIGIPWPIPAAEIILSDKDRRAPVLGASDIYQRS